MCNTKLCTITTTTWTDDLQSQNTDAINHCRGAFQGMGSYLVILNIQGVTSVSVMTINYSLSGTTLTYSVFGKQPSENRWTRSAVAHHAHV